MARHLRRAVFLFTFIASAAWLVVFALRYGMPIPFLEGDSLLTSGSAYSFEIGMTREQCHRTVKSRYSQPGRHLRVLWEKNSETDSVLSRFENTFWAKFQNRRFGEYRESVLSMEGIELPLMLVDKWYLEMPARWINDVRLTFEGDKLVEIRRSRWLFPGP